MSVLRGDTMAEKRMFSRDVIDSDMFLDLPASAQALYFHLAMRADDDGFVNSPKMIRRMVGASDDDVRILCAKAFLIPFESGVIVIRHWRIHNTVRKDMKKPTYCKAEMAMLEVDDSGAYELRNESVTNPYRTRNEPVTESYRDCNELAPNPSHRLDKNRLDKIRLDNRGDSDESHTPSKSKSKKFIKPTIEEIEKYCKEKEYFDVNAQQFFDYYESKGWKVGNSAMKDWKAAVRNWHSRAYGSGTGEKLSQPASNPNASYDLDRWHEEAENMDFEALRKQMFGG